MQKGVVRKCLRFFTLYNIETFRDRVFEMILIPTFHRLTKNVAKSVITD